MSFRKYLNMLSPGQRIRGLQLVTPTLVLPLLPIFPHLAEEGSTKFHRVVFSDKKNLVFFEVGLQFTAFMSLKRTTTEC
jgi:hypothetical protein